jgi:DNA-directed RNA polymerase specialized sigma24 family protein
LNSDHPLHSDLLLLGKIAKRDRSAFCELFEERGPDVLGVLCRLLDRADAEDVLVDVFEAVWEQAPFFQPNGTSPFGWLLSLARSRAAERLHMLRALGRGCTRTSSEIDLCCVTP